MKLKERFEEFLKEQQEEFEALSRDLEQNGVYRLGITNMPSINFRDGRLTAPSKLVYTFFCQLADLEEEFSPKHDAIMEELELRPKAYKEALKELKALGYIVEEKGLIKMVQFPKADQKAFAKKMEKANQFGEVLDGLETMAEEIEKVMKKEDLDQLKELFGKGTTKGKEIKLDRSKNVNAQIFEEIAKDIQKDIPEQAKSIKVEIVFETGVAKVEIE